MYVYIQNGMADWEIGHVTSELCSKRFFRDDAPEVRFSTVGDTKETRRSMGGMNVVPDIAVPDIETGENAVLVLPGSSAWPELRKARIMDAAEDIVSEGGTVCAICGSTVALADRGILDRRLHTSNGPGFLEHFSPSYRGGPMYKDVPAVSDGGVLAVKLKSGDGPSTLDLVLTEFRLEPPEDVSVEKIESVTVDYGNGKPQELQKAYE